VVENLKDGLSTNLVGQHHSKLLVAKDIVCTLATSQSLGSGQGITKVLGVDKRSIKKGIKLRILLNTQNDAFWLSSKKAKRANALYELHKKIVLDWWSTKTTFSPNHKDIVRRRIKVKSYESHATHYLQIS
jgi:hypothetical protein